MTLIPEGHANFFSLRYDTSITNEKSCITNSQPLPDNYFTLSLHLRIVNTQMISIAIALDTVFYV